MSPTIDIDSLKLGMFVHLDLGWWQHPFALSSFLITSPDQITTIRQLGKKQLRWSPEKSRVIETPSGHYATAPDSVVVADAGDADRPVQALVAVPAPAPAAARAKSAAELQAEADALCQAQYAEAGRAWKALSDQVPTSPADAKQTSEALTRALLDKLMVDDEMCIRVLTEGLGDRSGEHALNVTVVSLLMGRVFGFAEAEMMDMGMGALLHDIGKLDLPERARHAEPHLTAAEMNVYRDHVAKGVAHGERMGLSTGAMQVLAQHHEMADGSGFPNRLNMDRMGAAARVVALVNRYDNLCNPTNPMHALTPHESLSMIFAQAKNKFDVTMLNAFIRMMGVYPPGSIVQLTDDRFAMVMSVNSSRPLKPKVRLCDPKHPPEAQPMLNLESHPNLGIRRSLRPHQLALPLQQSLGPMRRMVYFFEPVTLAADQPVEELAA